MDAGLNDLFGQLLNDPETMQKLESVLSGLSAPPPAAAPPVTPPVGEGMALAGMLPLLQNLVSGGDDKEVALLSALRPYLRDEREKRVDEAIEMLRLAKLLPLITGKLGEMPHG